MKPPRLRKAWWCGCWVILWVGTTMGSPRKSNVRDGVSLTAQNITWSSFGLGHSLSRNEGAKLGMSRSTEKHTQYAYVTVHYEGTTRDPEYVLGIQVLMQSIRLTGTKYDLVVMVSSTVSQASRALFQSIGCKLIDVENIENPFINKTLKNKNFIYTLNKLHLWNLVQYKRVVYFDADNLVIRNSDELFQCGKFCAVFMNPCHFHTGLLVITPDVREYQRLIHQLQKLASFDGADQGFLSSMYSDELRRASLFKYKKDAVKPEALPSTQRLPAGYNINHKYYYEQYHWKLFLLHHFAEMVLKSSSVPVIVESARPIPAVTIGFPMASSLKPWYWWATFILNLNWVWQDVRGTIPASQERYGLGNSHKSLMSSLVATFILGGTFFLLSKYLDLSPFRRRLLAFEKSYQPTPFWIVCFRYVVVIFAWYMAPKNIHPLTPSHQAFSLFILNQNLAFVSLAACISAFWNSTRARCKPIVLWCSEFWWGVGVSVAAQCFIVWLSLQLLFSNVLWRLLTLAFLVVCTIAWQVRLLRYAEKVETRPNPKETKTLDSFHTSKHRQE